LRAGRALEAVAQHAEGAAPLGSRDRLSTPRLRPGEHRVVGIASGFFMKSRTSKRPPDQGGVCAARAPQPVDIAQILCGDLRAGRRCRPARIQVEPA
jgi:hypothetical protein